MPREGPIAGLVRRSHHWMRRKTQLVRIVRLIELSSYNHICSVVFQQIDIGNASSESGPLLRMFGVTEVSEYFIQKWHPSQFNEQAGHSVLANVTDFFPYFYVPYPRGLTDGDLDSLRHYLNVSIDSGNNISSI